MFYVHCISTPASSLEREQRNKTSHLVSLCGRSHHRPGGRRVHCTTPLFTNQSGASGAQGAVRTQRVQQQQQLRTDFSCCKHPPPSPAPPPPTFPPPSSCCLHPVMPFIPRSPPPTTLHQTLCRAVMTHTSPTVSVQMTG